MQSEHLGRKRVVTEPNFVEPTLVQQQAATSNSIASNQSCCLVQIYPTDVVDGLQKVSSDCFVLGRDARCDLVLHDGNVSRQHAKIQRVDGGYRLTDLDSTNGTFVNDHRIQSIMLTGGETLRLGSFIFKFLSADCLEAQYHETVYNAMTRDGLTGAFNKNYLLDSLGQELAKSRRSGRSVSLIMMDIDHFKSVNDTHGHLVGDEVLKEFSARLQKCCRAGDLFCRYGGEEFALVMSDTDLIEATEVAERCREVISATPFRTAAGLLPITTSLGVIESTLLDHLIEPSDMIKTADEYLYQAKRSGRNRVCGPELDLFDSLSHANSSNLQLVIDPPTW